MIYVSKPYLPPLDEYHALLQQVWKNGWITNHGPLVSELEKRLSEYLQTTSVQFVASGTTALQMAIKMANLTGEIITTAFSHVATVDAIVWSGCTPVFVDIQPTDFCIDPDLIERAITNKTSAVVATHVYGSPCDVARIEEIAKAYHLMVIYDAAHAFGVKVRNQSIFTYGDVSAVSLHATKLYHTIEGGAIIGNDADLMKRCRLAGNFGMQNNHPVQLGTNGKNSEVHAAMGLCTLSSVPQFIAKRKLLSDTYKKHLSSLNLQYPEQAADVEYNYSYFPVVFSSEAVMLSVMAALEKENVFPRRYFYPSLNRLPFCNSYDCPVAEDIAGRILCLPLYYDLSLEEVAFISSIIKSSLQEEINHSAVTHQADQPGHTVALYP